MNVRRRRISHVVGFDDAPFDRTHRGDVPIVGAVFASGRFEAILSERVRRDGANSAARIISAVASSRFASHLQLVMLQGIAMAGFNVVDVFEVNRHLGLPVLVVARHEPDLASIRDVLSSRIAGGARKWRIIERLGPMERCVNVWVQRVGLNLREAESVVERFAIHSSIPEPLRAAHIVAGGLVTGESRGRV